MEYDANAKITITENKQKHEKGLKITTIITSILAVCGITFGVYEIMQSVQKDGQISDLKGYVSKISSRNTELEEQITEKNKTIASLESETTAEGTPASSSIDNQASPSTAEDAPFIGDDRSLTYEVQNGTFILKSYKGELVAMDDTKNVSGIVACDVSLGSPYMCKGESNDGKSIWFSYDYDTKKLTSGFSKQ